MCFNAPSSLLAWGFANTIAIYLWKRNQRYDRWNAAFIFTFTLIQLLEAGIWSTSSKYTNCILTALILVALLAQPLVQNYMGWIYTKRRELLRTTLIFGVLLIWGIIKASTEKFKTYPGPQGHLIWGDTHPLSPFTGLYLLGLFVPLLFMGAPGYPLIGIGVITFAYSWIRTQGKEFSSLWCFTAILYALVALLET